MLNRATVVEGEDIESRIADRVVMQLLKELEFYLRRTTTNPARNHVRDTIISTLSIERDLYDDFEHDKRLFKNSKLSELKNERPGYYEIILKTVEKSVIDFGYQC